MQAAGWLSQTPTAMLTENKKPASSLAKPGPEAGWTDRSGIQGPHGTGILGLLIIVGKFRDRPGKVLT